MSVSDLFSASYGEARAKFLAAADAAGARVSSYPHPLKGPDGGDLATDLAWLGPADAAKVLVLTSATHGVEGFCGSGCQIGFLCGGLAERLPANTAALMVHAHNPHGFAHLRRVTEDNIDLNRNFVDYDAPLPENPAYDEVHAWLLPDDWDGPARAAADAAIAGYIEKNGAFAYQAAVSAGQYRHTDGLFFGGQGPGWSHRTIERLAQETLAGRAHVGVIDFHTGLGPRGHGELIALGRPGDPLYDDAKAWYGDEAKSPEMGDSASAEVSGSVELGYVRALPEARVNFVALEYGTLPPEQVLNALRGDNWLYLRGQVDSELGRRIKQDVRDAFYGDDDAWKQMVWDRADEIVGKALAGLEAA